MSDYLRKNKNNNVYISLLAIKSMKKSDEVFVTTIISKYSLTKKYKLQNIYQKIFIQNTS